MQKMDDDEITKRLKEIQTVTTFNFSLNNN